MAKLRVVHFPQLGSNEFIVEVETPEEGYKLMNVLANYDLFQYENKIKPDYSNATILEEWCEEEGEWLDWYSEDGFDIHQYMEEQ